MTSDDGKSFRKFQRRKKKRGKVTFQFNRTEVEDMASICFNSTTFVLSLDRASSNSDFETARKSPPRVLTCSDNGEGGDKPFKFSDRTRKI